MICVCKEPMCAQRGHVQIWSKGNAREKETERMPEALRQSGINTKILNSTAMYSVLNFNVEDLIVWENKWN